ncbi:MAG: RNA polymerase sigma factor [Saprospiraceae bacterium]
MNQYSYAHLSDVELFTNYQSCKDNAAFGELYRRYYNKVFSYVFTILKDREEAYDLTEETFLTIAEKAQSLRNAQLFVAWLFRIARNNCLDYKKQKQRLHFKEISQIAELADESFDYESAILHETLLIQIKRGLAEMPTDIRELLLARYLHKKSISELQAVYQLSESAMKMRLFRARDKMMQYCNKLRA